jgi:hypothetical protein
MLRSSPLGSIDEDMGFEQEHCRCPAFELSPGMIIVVLNSPDQKMPF